MVRAYEHEMKVDHKEKDHDPQRSDASTDRYWPKFPGLTLPSLLRSLLVAADSFESANEY